MSWASRIDRAVGHTTFLWLCAVIIAAVAAMVGGALLSPQHAPDIGFELAKNGAQLLTIGIFGGLATAALRERDAERERIGQEREVRLEFLRRFMEAYNNIKLARRTLQQLRIAEPGPVEGRDRIDAAAEQISVLNGQQIAIEGLVSDVQSRPRLWSASHAELIEELRGAESYVNRVCHDWSNARRGDGAEARLDAPLVRSFAESRGSFLPELSARKNRIRQVVFDLNAS